ncbi:MAG: AzlD domain-containing protein [Ruminococcaceae bacterium]|nr:AzlD domain-containing protein [Oscillospiraceae bacterium]
MEHNVYIYIACMVIVTFLIRVLPLTLIRKEIKNKTVKSFLYYVPYVTLAVMTFPAILSATQSPIAAAVALVAAMLLAYFGKGLFFTAVSACVIVFVAELFTHPPAFIMNLF